MTENEAIEALRLINTSRVHPFYSWEEMAEVRDIAISAIEEIQQYRAIGTVEECRKAVEKQKAKKCDVTKDNFRIYYKCPTCNHCLRVEYNHGSWMGKKSKNCSKCGQAINWEESEEEYGCSNVC